MSARSSTPFVGWLDWAPRYGSICAASSTSTEVSPVAAHRSTVVLLCERGSRQVRGVRVTAFFGHGCDEGSRPRQPGASRLGADW